MAMIAAPDERGGVFLRVLTGICIFLFLALMAFGLYLDPTKTWMKQKTEMGTLQQKLDAGQTRNNKLIKEQSELMSDAYIERKAREELGLIKPGEEAFVVVDPAKKAEVEEVPKAPAKESFVDKIKKYLTERDKAVQEAGEGQ